MVRIMSKGNFFVLSLAILGLFFLVAGCTQSGSVNATPTQVATALPTEQAHYTSNETLVAFVNEAADYAKTQGKTKALAEFNNPNGSFVRGELYVYAYDFNGTTLAHPVNPEAVGKVREGANGVFVQDMGAVVRNGSGFYRFTYINPVHNNTLESKLGYGINVDDTWWLGSGVYNGPVNPVTPAARETTNTT